MAGRDKGPCRFFSLEAAPPPAPPTSSLPQPNPKTNPHAQHDKNSPSPKQILLFFATRLLFSTNFFFTQGNLISGSSKGATRFLVFRQSKDATGETACRRSCSRFFISARCSRSVFGEASELLLLAVCYMERSLEGGKWVGKLGGRVLVRGRGLCFSFLTFYCRFICRDLEIELRPSAVNLSIGAIFTSLTILPGGVRILASFYPVMVA